MASVVVLRRPKGSGSFSYRNLVRFLHRFFIVFFWISELEMEPEIDENHQNVASDSVSGSDSVFSLFLDQKREPWTFENIGFS